ncbi:MAG: EamA family transporter [Clostridia bacterium]|nr:EamA family transporter [Clostridia bacterium]
MVGSYIMLCASVLMFGLQFRFNQIYEKNAGNSLRAAFVFITGYSSAGLIILLFINGLHFDFTAFTFIMSILTALDFIACSYFSIKAFSVVNISLFSVFSMLGGMLLPFVSGIVFFHEALNTAKIVCILFLVAAICVTFERKKNNAGMRYCFAVFFFNGMSGVLSKIFQASEYPKTNESVYSFLCAAMTALIAASFLPFIRGEKIRFTKKIVVAVAGYGILNRVANYLLLLSLAVLPASVQYPFITGGVIIVSVVIGFFTHQKPTKREMLSVALSAAGITALMLL